MWAEGDGSTSCSSSSSSSSSKHPFYAAMLLVSCHFSFRPEGWQDCVYKEICKKESGLSDAAVISTSLPTTMAQSLPAPLVGSPSTIICGQPTAMAGTGEAGSQPSATSDERYTAVVDSPPTRVAESLPTVIPPAAVCTLDQSCLVQDELSSNSAVNREAAETEMASVQEPTAPGQYGVGSELSESQPASGGASLSSGQVTERGRPSSQVTLSAGRRELWGNGGSHSNMSGSSLVFVPRGLSQASHSRSTTADMAPELEMDLYGISYSLDETEENLP